MGATVIAYTTPIRRVSRHMVERAGTVTFSSSYATGGDDFAPVVGKSILEINVETDGVKVFKYTAGKLLAFWPQGGSSTGPNTGLGAGVTAAGAVAVTADADDATLVINSGAMREVANATDLSAVTVRWRALGKK